MTDTPTEQTKILSGPMYLSHFKNLPGQVSSEILEKAVIAWEYESNEGASKGVFEIHLQNNVKVSGWYSIVPRDSRYKVTFHEYNLRNSREIYHHEELGACQELCREDLIMHLAKQCKKQTEVIAKTQQHYNNGISEMQSTASQLSFPKQ